MLAEAYKTIAAEKSFEIVFVSSDRDEKSFQAYYGEMPWLALPLSEQSTKEALSAKFGVRGIPFFVLLDGATGEVISTDGRSIIEGDRSGSKFPWKGASSSSGGCTVA